MNKPWLKVVLTDGDGVVIDSGVVDPNEAEGLEMTVEQYLDGVVDVVLDGIADTMRTEVLKRRTARADV